LELLSQPEKILSEEHVRHVMPMIELDREWDDLRRKTHIYLVVAYGFSLMTCFGIISDNSNTDAFPYIDTIETAAVFFSIGLIVCSFSFVVYLLSAWISMRNRKKIFAGANYHIGYWESRYSQLSGVLGCASALWFSYTIGYALFEIWSNNS
tara:strand:+ start:976 stop:1431 length:456 start_codon:yes stop_codon:yes gene_type:complete